MYKYRVKQNKSTSDANSIAKNNNSGQQGFYLEDSRHQSVLRNNGGREDIVQNNNIANINNHSDLTAPIQLVSHGEGHLSESEEEETEDKHELSTFEAEAKFNEYINCIPKDVLEGDDKEQWVKALKIIYEQILKKKQLPPNPYSAELEKKRLYRGTSLVDGSLYKGSDGSARNTPTTPSAEVAVLFALKAKSEGYKGVVAHSTVQNIKNKKIAFSAPDTMAGQEQEITLRASPENLNDFFEKPELETFVKALRTVGVDYTKYIGSGIQSGAAFDGFVKNAKTLPVNSENQLGEFLGNPELIKKWENFTSSRNEIIDKIKNEKTAIEIKLGKRKDDKNKYFEAMKAESDLFLNLTEKVNIGPLFLLDDLKKWCDNYKNGKFEEKITSAIVELNKKIANYDEAKKTDDKLQEDDFDLFGDDE